jgi:hypothetical protein
MRRESKVIVVIMAEFADKKKSIPVTGCGGP